VAQNFLTPEQVKIKLSSLFGTDPARFPAARWDDIILEATANAKNKIIEKLFGRGFSLAQLYTWDALENYHVKQALYECLIAGAMRKLHTVPLEVIDRYNIADELDSLGLISGDTELVPVDETAGGAVSGGELDNANDRYTRDMEF
jgi:hypothetical protein